jgi:ribonucleoside-diphosphate reductase alpha chain
MLTFKYYFSNPDVDPFDEIVWETRTASIKEDGKTLFQQEIEVPSFWSQNATDIVAQHYLKVVNGEKEKSVKQCVSRISKAFSKAGIKYGYFDKDVGKIFEKELRWLLINQYFCFNSPVWYNLGIEEKGQLSACFIQSVEDSLQSLCELQTSETFLFRNGSGTGTNFSVLREKNAGLSGGGGSSGPVSFMKGYDTWAGVTKSAGKTRRAAKLICLDVDHPDIEEFIDCKVIPEKMARDLIKSGWPSDYNGIVYSSLPYQNANHSVRVTNDFMKAVENDEEYELKYYKGAKKKHLKAKEVFRKIAEAAHFCADPGLQFHDTINEWHTSPQSGPIVASNPCSEYMYLDDTACNLASHNLKKYIKDGKFNCEALQYSTELGITAMEIAVEISSYPTKKITENSKKFRPLGIGWSNGGALLMELGIPYDSEKGRFLLASITSLLTASAYRQSGLIAKEMGACEGFIANKKPFLKIIKKHSDSNHVLKHKAIEHKLDTDIRDIASKIWEEVENFGIEYGFRNSQTSVLAPCGTISFMMDCDTTGVEPDIALVKYKKLAGGGALKIVNQSVKPALINLGYTLEEVDLIEDHLLKYETILGAPHLKREHLSIFDCAVGVRCIKPMGHIKMMAELQPFLSGAISKTVNLPVSATIEDIENIYMQAWKLGLKAIAIYRDNCKSSQPLNVKDYVEQTDQTCNFCDGRLVKTGSCHTCRDCGVASSCS